jgi:DNA-directed RNA polymerase subunit RPC12/RpoP
MALAWMAQKKKYVHRCPSCRSYEIERVGRKGFGERVLLLLARQRPYRCLRCSHRFYDRRA